MAKEIKAGGAFIEVYAKLDKLNSGMEEAKRKVEKAARETEKSFASIGEKLKDVGAKLGLAFGTYELINFTKEAIIASAQLEVLRSNFKGTTEDIELFRKATAGTVTEANLIKLSNQASDLGISLQDQAILFSLAEDSADKYGTSVEEGMTKVIAASEGSRKGLKALGIQKAVYEEIVKSLAKAEGDSFKNLDAETQKQIQVQAILKATGMTIEEVKNKLPDAADKIEQFYVGVEELKTGFGEIVREGLPQFLEMMVGVATNTLPAIEAQNELNRAIENEMKLRKMQKDLYKDTISYVGDLAEKEVKGKSSSQLSKMINDLETKIERMKGWAGKQGFTDDTKNDLEQQQRRLSVYSATLNLMKEKDIERHKKLQEQRDKDLQIEKDYYAAVRATGSVSLERILNNVDIEVTERYKKLSEAARKEVDLEKWKAAERIKAEEDYYNNVIKNSPEYQHSQALIEGKYKPKKTEFEHAIGPQIVKEPPLLTDKQLDDMDKANQKAETFAHTISSVFVNGIADGKNFGEVLANIGTQLAEMTAEALIFEAIFSLLNPGGLSGGMFQGLFKATGGSVSAGSPYIVGEKGMELFVPNSSGYVVPNNMLSSISNYNDNHNNVTFTSNTDRELLDEVRNLNKTIKGLSINPVLHLDGKKIAEVVTRRQNEFTKGNVNISR